MSQYSFEATLHLYDVIFEVIRLITKVIALGIGNIDSYIIGTSEKSENAWSHALPLLSLFVCF